MSIDNLMGMEIDRRSLLRTGSFVTASGLLIPAFLRSALAGETNIKRIPVTGELGEMTGINVVRYLDGSVEGDLGVDGFYDDVLNFMRLERGNTVEKVLRRSREGIDARVFTDFAWEDGSRVDLDAYREANPGWKIGLVDRPAIDGTRESLDYVFAGDTWFLDLDEMLASEKPGVAETARKLADKYKDPVIELTPNMMNEWALSDSGVNQTVSTYVAAVEEVYGAGHAATMELRRLQRENPMAVLGKMITAYLGQEGGMYHDLTQGDGAITVRNVVKAAEAGETAEYDAPIAPALAHRVDPSKTVIYWGLDYAIVNPATGEHLKDRMYGIFAGTELHHVLNERDADMSDILGVPTVRGIEMKTFDERKLPSGRLPHESKPFYHQVWSGSKSEYKRLLEKSVTVGPDLTTVTDNIRPSWIDPARFQINYFAFQGVKHRPTG